MGLETRKQKLKLNKYSFIVNNYIISTFMVKIIKSAIGMIVLAFTSLVLFTGSPFQIANNLVENNGHLYIKNNEQGRLFHNPFKIEYWVCK